MSEETNGTGQLPTEPGSVGQCGFDTRIARATADGSRYQHHSTLAALLVSACDEIDRLRTEVAELKREAEYIKQLPNPTEICRCL